MACTFWDADIGAWVTELDSGQVILALFDEPDPSKQLLEMLQDDEGVMVEE
jgi:hypothetical protein